MKTILKRGFTLMEVLVVCALLTFILSLIGKLFIEGRASAVRMTRRADNNQMILVIMKKWQTVLQDTDPTSWNTVDDVFRAGDIKAYYANDRLHIDKGESRFAIHLPEGANCIFATERNADSPNCAVLNLKWNDRYYTVEKTKSVRIVSCGRRQ